MTYLNSEQRDKLLDELSKMKYNKAKGKLRRMDGELALFRNVQNPGEWVTRYDLDGLGTIVTLVESKEVSDDPSERDTAKYELIRVEVAPTPDNRT